MKTYLIARMVHKNILKTHFGGIKVLDPQNYA